MRGKVKIRKNESQSKRRSNKKKYKASMIKRYMKVFKTQKEDIKVR